MPNTKINSQNSPSIIKFWGKWENFVKYGNPAWDGFYKEISSVKLGCNVGLNYGENT